MSLIALDNAPPSRRDRTNFVAVVVAVVLFAAGAIYCAIKSASDVEADAVTHYMIARFALEDHIHLVSVWGRPLCTLLYVIPAVLGRQVGVRLMSLALALVIGFFTYRIAVRQKMKYPALSLVLLLAQPLFFVHAWSSLTEIPFAVFLTAAFWAYQRRSFLCMTVLIAFTPLGRPEGFGFVLLAAFALVMHRKWWWLVILPLPFLAWNYAGWVVIHRPPDQPWWDWVHRNWPYSSDSMYAKGPLLKYVGRLPAMVGPFAFPFAMLGTWIFLRAGRRKAAQPAGAVTPRQSYTVFSPSPGNPGEGRGEGSAQGLFHVEQSPVASNPLPNPLPEYREREQEASAATPPLNYESPVPLPTAHDSTSLLDLAPVRWVFVPRDHLARCAVWIAIIPLMILVVHSLLHWTGRMGSSGELRYLLISAPFWALLAAGGVEWFAARYSFAHPFRWVAIGSLVPMLANWHDFPRHELPFPRYADDYVAKAAADWYKANPRLQDEYPRVVATPTGVWLHLDIGLNDQAHAGTPGKAGARSPLPGTILFWDVTGGNFNSNSENTMPKVEMAKGNWIYVGEFECSERTVEIYLSPKDIKERQTVWDEPAFYKEACD